MRSCGWVCWRWAMGLRDVFEGEMGERRFPTNYG